jgi:hypothetical protein
MSRKTGGAFMPSIGISGLALALGLLFSFVTTEVWAEVTDQAALAKALEAAGATLEDGLEAARPVGRPISAKFEIEKGRLQLSVYAITGEGYAEVFVSTSTGVLMATQTMTDAEDLEAAAAQKNAMEPTTTTLAAATKRAIQQNSGSRAISVIPELQAGQPIAKVTHLTSGGLRTVSEDLK